VETVGVAVGAGVGVLRDVIGASIGVAASSAVRPGVDSIRLADDEVGASV